MEQNPWHVSPPPHLKHAIIRRIKSDVRHKATLTLSFYGVLMLGALSASIPVYQYMKVETTRTGFFEFLYLTYSDSALAITHWREMLFTLLESLPIVSMTLVFTLTLITLASLRMMARASHKKTRLQAF